MDRQTRIKQQSRSGYQNVLDSLRHQEYSKEKISV